MLFVRLDMAVPAFPPCLVSEKKGEVEVEGGRWREEQVRNSWHNGMQHYACYYHQLEKGCSVGGELDPSQIMPMNIHSPNKYLPLYKILLLVNSYHYSLLSID